MLFIDNKFPVTCIFIFSNGANKRTASLTDSNYIYRCHVSLRKRGGMSVGGGGGRRECGDGGGGGQWWLGDRGSRGEEREGGNLLPPSPPPRCAT